MSEALPQIRISHSPSIGALAAALAKAQSSIASAPKNHTAEVTMKSGGKYTYAYADLAGVWEAAKGPLSANGLALVQLPTLSQGGLTLTTLLMHSSGEYVRGDLENFPVPDRTPQGVGTAITYARRYSFGAMTGVVSEEDDDGGNGGRPKAKRSEAATAPKPPPATPKGSEAAPASAGNTTAVFPNYGRAKGESIKGAHPDNLRFYMKGAQRSLADASKAKFHDKERALLNAIEAELARQNGGADGGSGPAPFFDNEPPPPGDDDAPF